MKSSVGYLVILMVMLAVFSSVRFSPPGLTHLPGNLALGAVLLLGALAVALRRPWSYAAGLVAAAATAVAGGLSLRGYLGMLLPSNPVIWIVAGLYLAFRLSLNQHADAERGKPGAEARP